jgi:hypothetical protein
MPDTMQPGDRRKSSKGGGKEGALHITPAAFKRWNDERNVNVNRNDNDWNDNWWFAGRRNSLHFLPRPLAGSSFANCPIHPPSILPTASNSSESIAYFFVSSDLVSHKIMSNTFAVSSLRIASRTHGSFSARTMNVA